MLFLFIILAWTHMLNNCLPCSLVSGTTNMLYKTARTHSHLHVKVLKCTQIVKVSQHCSILQTKLCWMLSIRQHYFFSFVWLFSVVSLYGNHIYQLTNILYVAHECNWKVLLHWDHPIDLTVLCWTTPNMFYQLKQTRHLYWDWKRTRKTGPFSL